jgi:hypothetical protein
MKKPALQTVDAPEKTFQVVLTESDACLILSALLNLERAQVRLAKAARNEGRLKQARARVETGKRILALTDRIEKAAI